MPPQHVHRYIVFHALPRLDFAVVAHDRKTQAPACGPAVNGDPTPAARTVLATKPSAGMVRARNLQGVTLHLVAELSAIQLHNNGDHLLCIPLSARKTVDVCSRMT
jgi:hypothetical protein